MEQTGYKLLVFRATSAGGQAMERLVTDGFIKGVLDITTTELADELVGGVLTAARTVEAAAKMGLPQVVSVGASGVVNFGASPPVARYLRYRFTMANRSTMRMPTKHFSTGFEITPDCRSSSWKSTVRITSVLRLREV